MLMESVTLTDRVYEVLRERILKGDYAAGEKLNLAQISRDLGVSNSPIREAMARLERVGLIEVIPYVGPKVKRLSAEQVADLFDVRIALEIMALQRAIEKNDPSLFDGMTAAIELQEQLRGSGDRQAQIDADRAFHDALVKASGNSVLLEMLPTLSDRTRLLLELNSTPAPQIDTEQRLKKGVNGHQRILKALLDGDEAKAVLALREELTSGKERVLLRMKQD